MSGSTNGVVTLNWSALWNGPEHFSTTGSSTPYDLHNINCAPPNGTIQGTSTCATTAAARPPLRSRRGPSRPVVPASRRWSQCPNPLAPTTVLAGGYTMTTTNPPNYQLVACGG